MQRLHGVGLFCLLALACGDDGSDGSDGSTGAATTSTTAPSTSTTASTSTTTPTGSTSSTGTTDGTSTSSTTDPSTSTSNPSTGSDTSGSGSGSGSSTGAEVAVATADIVSKSGSTAVGSASFFEDGEQIRVEIQVSMTDPEGLHGVHIHETGDCSAEDGSSAGGHWNPAGADHGPFEAGHLGDMGNIDVDAAGNGSLVLTTTMGQWAVGSGDDAELIGRAIILHELEDDLSTMPNPGPRIGCGEVVAK